MTRWLKFAVLWLAACWAYALHAQINLPLLGVGGGSTVNPVFRFTFNIVGGSNGVTTSSFANFMTASSNPNRLIMAGMVFTGGSAGTSPSCTWAGTSMADAIGNNTDRLFMFGLRAPASGLQTLACSWTGSSQVVVAGIEFDNVNQGGGAATYGTYLTNSGSTNLATVSPVGSANGLCWAAHDSNSTFTTGSGTTIGAVTGNTTAGAANYDNPGTALTYTQNAAIFWESNGVCVKPA